MSDETKRIEILKFTNVKRTRVRPGDVLDVEPRDAKLLINLGKAKEAAKDAKPKQSGPNPDTRERLQARKEPAKKAAGG